MLLLYVQLLSKQIMAFVSHYDQSARTANWWRSSKRSTYCKHRCATVLAQKSKWGPSDVSWNQLNQARWSWIVLKFDSENQWSVHNYLQRWCNWTQPKKSPVLDGPLKTIKPTKIPLLTFPLKMYYEGKSKISSTLVQLTANFFEWYKTNSNEIWRTCKKENNRTVWVNSTGYLLQLCKFGIF